MERKNNQAANLNNIYNTELTEQEFIKLSQYIMTEYGIKMPPEKKIMLQSRLQKRLKLLQINNFSDYISYLFSPHGMSEEVIHMMDVVSTNKTDFFRESAHFDFMLSNALPELAEKKTARKLKIWSAGCSSGEEPYTIAITMSEFIETHPGFDYEIFATDISTKMLENGVSGIYKAERINNLPFTIKKKYFLRSKNREEDKVRVMQNLRQKVSFSRLNLLELYPVREPSYHIIFCRNVLIYFDRPTQYQILTALCSHLVQGGFLFLGHSESIAGLELPVNTIIPTVFQKKEL